VSADIPAWVEWVAAVLLVTSGLLSLVGAIGLLRLRDFFQRMHPPALSNTLGAWCVALASILYFSATESHLALHAWLLNILLAITAPVTTVLLARAALFRKRQRGANVPPPLGNGE
jgi:multicomponent K+:H+ antiporter subunit G